LSVTLPSKYVGNVTLTFAATALAHPSPSPTEPHAAPRQRKN
jgi:hypothetical protein